MSISGNTGGSGAPTERPRPGTAVVAPEPVAAEVEPPIGSRLRLHDSWRFVIDKAGGFVGRRALTERVEEWRLHGEEKVLIVTGEAGIGKSTWLANMVHRPEVVAVHCCQYNEPESLKGQVWLENVARRLLEWAAGQGLSPSKECEEVVLAQREKEAELRKQLAEVDER